jgi:hypothetical protein
MIDQIDLRLIDWIKTILGDVTVILTPPPPLAGESQGEGVSLYLLDLVSTPPASGAGLAPLQYSVRYLVSTWAADPSRAHLMLSNLAFAGLENHSLELIFEPLPAETWVSFGVAARPSFLLKTIVRKERIQPPTPLVEKLLVLNTVPAGSLYGLIRTKDGLPVVGARVEVPALSLSTASDARGRFSFSTLPAGRPAKLRVKAKGKQLEVEVGLPTSPVEPYVIEFDPRQI